MRLPPYRRGQMASQQEKGICLPGSTSRASATLGQIPSSLGCFALRGREIEPVAAAQALGDAFEFLSDLVNRFPLPTLGGEYTRPAQPVADPVDAVAESSIADVGDASPARQPDLNDACASSNLFAPDSKQSMCRDDPQAPFWTKRENITTDSVSVRPTSSQL
ncbi:uncharacterized protein [Triticum aestivum]|uniref:uncharacterized protein isoform X2 n=1 Tax=Triticum aestivum TaxID=4565 RepID=UPI001D0107B1|nr:uncharacterized protein LOC123131618 isoform X2 [Triticum aestivum]